MLSSLADEQILPEESSRVRTHIAHCPQCAAYLSFLRASQAALWKLPDAYPSPALTARIARRTYAKPTLGQRIGEWLAPLPVRASLSVVAAALAGFAILSRQPVVLETPVLPAKGVATLPAARSTKTAKTAVSTAATKEIAVPRLRSGAVAVTRASDSTMPSAKSADTSSALAASERKPVKEKTIASIATRADSPKIAKNPVIMPKTNLIKAIPQNGAKPITTIAMNAVIKPTPKPSPVETKTTPIETGVKPIETPAKIMVAEAVNGDYSPESGRIRLAIRRNNAVPMTVALNPNDRQENGSRAALNTIGGTSPGDNQGVRGSIVSAPTSLN